MRRTAVAALALVALIGIASPVFAEASASDVALAETLFQEGQKLLKEQRYAEACPKFEESQRLDPGGGTLFQLATCHEFIGRTASAWAEFSEVALLAKQRNRPDIERAARERIRSLEPRLSWLVVVVPKDARVDGLSVKRDGTVIGPATFGTAMPADPGKHTIIAEAQGHRAWSTTVEIGEASDRKTVTVPELETLPSSPAPAPSSEGGAWPDPETRPARARHSPALFYASAGVGLAGLGTAAFSVFARTTRSKKRRRSARTPSAPTDRQSKPARRPSAPRRLQTSQALSDWLVRAFSPTSG